MELSTNSDPNLASQFALRVALQTMKERCLALQRRLTTVDEENQQLREASDGKASAAAQNGGGAAENLQLRLQIAELQRQKTQQTTLIEMVSNENRKLWSRLSQMAKEQGKSVAPMDKDCTLINNDDSAGGAETEGAASPRSSANQNLIRSKTFTQHSPNPHLRHKLIPSEGASGMKDISLDDVTLEAYADKDMGAGEDYAEAELAFAYLNVDETVASASGSGSETEFNLEAKKCIEGLQEMRREAMKQQQELNSTLAVLESRIALQPCSECAQKSQKPEMADKSLETDESLSEVKYYNSSQIMQQEPTHTLNGHAFESVSPPPVRLNIIQEKIQADAMDKTCPMCGKIYSSHVSFNNFREHVEMHFIDDSNEVEVSNFELISHTVGNF